DPSALSTALSLSACWSLCCLSPPACHRSTGCGCTSLRSLAPRGLCSMCRIWLIISP
ncbi:hypothetical protein KI387_024397, partial [Taxus chinensis]